MQKYNYRIQTKYMKIAPSLCIHTQQLSMSHCLGQINIQWYKVKLTVSSELQGKTIITETTIKFCKYSTFYTTFLMLSYVTNYMVGPEKKPCFKNLYVPCELQAKKIMSTLKWSFYLPRKHHIIMPRDSTHICKRRKIPWYSNVYAWNSYLY